MKHLVRTAAVFALIAAMILTLAGCASAKKEEPVTGGWQTAEDGTVTEELQEMFDRAFEGYTGVSYTPLELLETQIVSGKNFRFLCRATDVGTGGEYEAVVTIYQDLEGNVKILEIEKKEEATMQVTNPFVTVETLHELNEKSPVRLEELPETIAGVYTPDAYRYSEVLTLAEVIYGSSENEDDRIIVRKAPYAKNEDHTVVDISGDYNEYDSYAEVDGIDFACSVAGNGGLINKASWEDSGWSYVILINPGTDRGLDSETVFELVRTIR